MSKLTNPLDMPVWGVAGRTLHFERTGDLIRWAEEEIKHWTFEQAPKAQALQRPFEEQRTSLSQVANWARQLEPLLSSPEPVSMSAQQSIAQANNNLLGILNSFGGGARLTSEHPNFRFIAGLVEKDVDAAAILLIASRSNAHQALLSLGQNLPHEAIARMSVSVAEMEEGKDVAAYRSKLSSVSNDAEKVLSSMRSEMDKESARSGAMEKEHSERVEAHRGEWAGLLEQCEKDWSNLKAVYS